MSPGSAIATGTDTDRCSPHRDPQTTEARRHHRPEPNTFPRSPISQFQLRGTVGLSMDGSELSIDISRSYHIIALSNSNSLSIYKTFITLEFILAEKLKLHGEYQQLATFIFGKDAAQRPNSHEHQTAPKRGSTSRVPKTVRSIHPKVAPKATARRGRQSIGCLPAPVVAPSSQNQIMNASSPGHKEVASMASRRYARRGFEISPHPTATSGEGS